MRHLSIRSALLAVALLGVLTPAAMAQQQNLPKAITVTMTARVAGTYDNAGPPNLSNRGAICTFNQTAHSASPSTTMAIQFQDAASATWQTAAISGAITADTTPTSVLVYPGAVATAVPTGMVIAGIKLATNWRVHVVQGGTGTITGTVGCELLN